MNKLVIDVGGTALKYALMDMDANILDKGSFPTPMESQEAFINVIGDLFEKYQDSADGVAMSIPGRVDTEKGFIYNSGALAYNMNTYLQNNLEDALKERFGRDIPVSLENDGKAAALAEAWKGNLADVDDGVVIVLGTGIGGGIIKDGKIFKGKHFFAGELSFLMNDHTKKGFANTLCTQTSASTLTSKTASYCNLPKEEVDGFKVFELVEQNNPGALQALDEVAQATAGLIYNLTCTLDPEKILIGGGISKQPLLIEKIKEKADEYYSVIDVIGVNMPRPEIDVCAHFNDSNLIGALYNYKLMYPED